MPEYSFNQNLILCSLNFVTLLNSIPTYLLIFLSFYIYLSSHSAKVFMTTTVQLSNKFTLMCRKHACILQFNLSGPPVEARVTRELGLSCCTRVNLHALFTLMRFVHDLSQTSCVLHLSQILCILHSSQTNNSILLLTSAKIHCRH